MKPLTSVLVKPAGPDCNMACRYCFYLEKERLFPAAGPRRMQPEVLDATVRQMLRAGSPEVSFGWQGGEPTLMGVDFFQQAVELQRRYGREGQAIANGLQTNGLLIDARWCAFLRAAQFLVGLSLDGPEHVHDHYRVARGGQPTWARVMTALRQLLDGGVAVNALVVVHDYAVSRAGEIYDFLKAAGLVHMQFIPCVDGETTNPAVAAGHAVDPAMFGQFLCDVFDRWWADFRDGRPTTFVRWFDAVFATYAGVRPPECSLLPECGEYVVVEHTGDVFSCDFFVEDEWRLGNVLSDDLTALLNSSQQARFGRRKAALPRACQTCRWRSYCRGGCPRERPAAGSTFACSRLCAAYQAFFEHADRRLRRLADDWRREHDGRATAVAPPPRADRNAPCPCGSGRKYKRCCGR